MEGRENVLEMTRNKRGTLPSPRAHVHTRSGRRTAAARGGWEGIGTLRGSQVSVKLRMCWGLPEKMLRLMERTGERPRGLGTQ